MRAPGADSAGAGVVIPTGAREAAATAATAAGTVGVDDVDEVTSRARGRPGSRRGPRRGAGRRRARRHHRRARRGGPRGAARHGARPAPRRSASRPDLRERQRRGGPRHPVTAPRPRDGDLVNVDVSAELDGYWADTGASAASAASRTTARRLLDATRLANRDALDAARAGQPLRHIGRAVQRRARRHGFSVIENLRGPRRGPRPVGAAERARHRGPPRPHRAVGGPRAGHRAVPVDGRHVGRRADDGWTLLTPGAPLGAVRAHGRGNQRCPARDDVVITSAVPRPGVT